MTLIKIIEGVTTDCANPFASDFATCEFRIAC